MSEVIEYIEHSSLNLITTQRVVSPLDAIARRHSKSIQIPKQLLHRRRCKEPQHHISPFVFSFP